MTVVMNKSNDLITVKGSILGIFPVKREYRLVESLNDQTVWYNAKLRQELTREQFNACTDGELLWGIK